MHHFSMFFLSDSISPNSTKSLYSFVAIDSGQPALNPTTGVPHDRDSATTIENVSRKLVITVTSASEYIFAKHSLWLLQNLYRVALLLLDLKQADQSQSPQKSIVIL